MNLPEAVKCVIQKITSSGGQAYLVGGALRDHLLNRPVMDYDMATSLLPDEVTSLFSCNKTWSGGKRFGTVTIEIDNINIEITTFRQETSYSDNRHPDKVYFVPDIYSDLSRRDFTINAMAWNPFDGLLDPFHGKEDLENRIIRTVGSPIKRFTEDPLRIMRGIRFSAQLDFILHEDTKKAMLSCSRQLQKVSAERLQDELNKLLLSQRPDKGLLELQDIAALPILFSPSDIKGQNTPRSLNKHNTRIIKHCCPYLALRLSALIKLLYDIDFNTPAGTALVKNKLRRLRYDNKIISHASKLLQAYSNFISMEITAYTMRKLLGQMGIDDTKSILNWAGLSNHYDNPNIHKNDHSEKLSTAGAILYNIINNKDPVFFEQLAVDGDDILKAGIGRDDPRKIGEALNSAYQWILENPGWNNRDYLIDKLKDRYI